MLALGLNSNGELGPLEEPFRVRVVGSGVVVVGRWEAVVGRGGMVTLCGPSPGPDAGPSPGPDASPSPGPGGGDDRLCSHHSLL